jgi:cell division protein FtsB
MGTKDEEPQSGQKVAGGLPEPRSRETRARRTSAAKAAPKRLARSFIELPKKTNPLVTVAVIVVLTVMALTVAQPLRNYFQQKADLAQVNAKIDDQMRERQDLSDELNRYRDENYVKEQARVRLGLVDPGETAYRLTDPKIDSVAPGAEDTPGEGDKPGDGDGDSGDNPWYTTLWGSISTPDHTSDKSEDGDGTDSPDPTSENLPIDPNQPEPEPAPEQE